MKDLSNEVLLKRTHSLIEEERRLNLEVIKHLKEISSRKLYLDRGYPSLFEMCTTEFKYSPAAAQRRIEAMRLLQDLPEMEEKIREGNITLSVAAQVQTFFRQEAKSENTYSQEEKRELLKTLEGKSTREVERELAKRSPESTIQERTRWVSEDRIELKLSLKGETYHALQKLKHLLSHKDPSMSFESLIEELADIALEKLDPERKEKRLAARKKQSAAAKEEAISDAETPSALPAPEVTSRHISNSVPIPGPTRHIPSPICGISSLTRSIPASIRREVYLRDKGRCTHKDHDTGRLCGSRHLLQVDHVHPKALGGKDVPENLRLLCAAHNQRRAQKTWPQITR